MSSWFFTLSRLLAARVPLGGTAGTPINAVSHGRPARGWVVPATGFTEVEEGNVMTEKKVWLITGAGRGMGVDFSKAALTAGDAVVATGRNTDAVTEAIGQADDLLVAKLDVTSRADAEA